MYYIYIHIFEVLDRDVDPKRVSICSMIEFGDMSLHVSLNNMKDERSIPRRSAELQISRSSYRSVPRRSWWRVFRIGHRGRCC